MRALAFIAEDEPHGDGRTVTFETSPRKVTRGGKTYTVVGGFDFVNWFCDSDGKCIEVDELGVSFYQADSLGRRLEQLALERERRGAPEVYAGRVGAALAKARGLVLVREAKDSGHCTWMQREGEPPCQVVESFEPTEYGKEERVWRTYVYERQGERVPLVAKRTPREKAPATASQKGPKRATKKAAQRATKKPTER